MKILLAFLLLASSAAIAHPGIGIVKDSKGNIYYTDLTHVWKITGSNRKIIIPNVHTHELSIDKNDYLYGEGTRYESATEKFYHYQWKLSPKGKLDTVTTERQAYQHNDYSLAKDKNGNEYFIAIHNTDRVYKRYPDGTDMLLAKGDFKGVSWLHPQDDNTVLYVKGNAVYRISSNGNIQQVAAGIGSTKPTFAFSNGNITLWGVWQDEANNVYVAVFSDQAVKRIDKNGVITTIYHSSDNYAPLHGVFDNEGKLWVLESSDKNEIRVVNAGEKAKPQTSSFLTANWMQASMAISVLVMFFVLMRFRNRSDLQL